MKSTWPMPVRGAGPRGSRLKATEPKGNRPGRVAGRIPWALCLVALSPLALCLAACVPTTQPMIKIGLVAPFEGRYRDVGYEVVYAVRLAVREANARGGVAGHVVELIALDDS